MHWFLVTALLRVIIESITQIMIMITLISINDSQRLVLPIVADNFISTSYFACLSLTHLFYFLKKLNIDGFFEAREAINIGTWFL